MKKEFFASVVLLVIFIGCTALYRGIPESDKSSAQRDKAMPTLPRTEAAK